MVAFRNYDSQHGLSARERPSRRKRTHTVRFTSDDVVSECQFEATDYIVQVLKDLARAINSNARFSVDVRMCLDPPSSAAHPGEVA